MVMNFNRTRENPLALHVYYVILFVGVIMTLGVYNIIFAYTP